MLRMKTYSDEEILLIKKSLKKFQNFYMENNADAIKNLVFTVLGLFTSLAAMKKTLVGVPIGAAFFLRLFLVFHDACHHNFFKITHEQFLKKDGANKILAKCLEPFVGYSYETWSKLHGQHHSVSGNANELDWSRTVITLEEYNSMHPILRIIYKILRSPPIFFSIAPLVLFWIKNIINPSIVAKYIAFMFIMNKMGISVKRVFFAQYFAAMIGVMLFHLQHTINEPYLVACETEMEKDRAQLHSASILEIPQFLKWITMGIEYHHIHHICPRIAGYNLQKAHEENAEIFKKTKKVSMKEAYENLRNTLYDEKNNRFL